MTHLSPFLEQVCLPKLRQQLAKKECQHCPDQQVLLLKPLGSLLAELIPRVGLDLSCRQQSCRSQLGDHPVVANFLPHSSCDDWDLQYELLGFLQSEQRRPS